MSSRGSNWSFRGSNLRCRDSRQPTSSSILSSCDTSSLLGFLLHRLSLLQHYSPVDLRVRDSQVFSLPLPSSRFPRPFSRRATLLFRQGSLHQAPVQPRPHLLTGTPFTDLSASYNELTGQPTPSHTTVVTSSGMLAFETVAPPVTGTGTTETVPSSVASTDPPTVGTCQYLQNRGTHNQQ
jgi:hypothetical protein